MSELTALSDLIASLTEAIQENTRARQVGEVEFIDKHAIAVMLNCHPDNVDAYHEGGNQKSGWMMGAHYVRRGVTKGPWLYNRALIQDWLRNRHDWASHLRAVDKWERSKMGNKSVRRKAG